jgi:hypothetical protein
MMNNDFTDGAPVTRDEYLQGMQEQVDNTLDVMRVVNELRKALNIQAEVLGCHRFILERFVPKPLLEQAATEYSEQRAAVIRSEAGVGSQPN